MPLLLAGCLRQVQLKPQPLVKMTRDNVPTTQRADGNVGLARNPQFVGDRLVVTLSYDKQLWAFTRIPYVRTRDRNERVMLDTGMKWWSRVTRDIAVRRGLPARDSGDGNYFAYTDLLPFDGIAIQALPSEVWNETYEVRAFGLSLYRLSAWILGSGILRNANYLAFDNPGRQVTIGREPFHPSAGRTWAEYEFERNEKTGAFDLYVTVPIAGQPVRIYADSGGGPNLILNPDQWEKIKCHVDVRHHKVDRYPTWGRFVTTDVYTIDRLQVGPATLRNEKISVRRDPQPEEPPLLGLGPLDECTVVWDYEHKKLWIGTKR